jgi:hypothetical protein
MTRVLALRVVSAVASVVALASVVGAGTKWG